MAKLVLMLKSTLGMHHGLQLTISMVAAYQQQCCRGQSVLVPIQQACNAIQLARCALGPQRVHILSVPAISPA
jgi:hypothetical protein